MSSPCRNIDELFSDGLPPGGAYNQVSVTCIFYDLILSMDRLEIGDSDDEGGRPTPEPCTTLGLWRPLLTAAT